MELCSMFLDQDILVPLNHSWLFLLTLTESQFVSEGYIGIGYSSVQKFNKRQKFVLGTKTHSIATYVRR